jgi:hypothetical protein
MRRLSADISGMSPAKKDRSIPLLPVGLKNLAMLPAGPGRTITAIALLCACLAIGGSLVWAGVKSHVLCSPDYTITQQQVHVTPLPKWIHADVRAEVFRNASLDRPLSILDDDLTERIANAFALHPWVAKVVRVTKNSPSQIHVELVYRRPVCMVDVSGDLLPVDAEGILLPSGDFSPIERLSYPCLADITTRPMGPIGQRWGDSRVVGGAAIASVLEPAWQQLRLFRIVPATRQGAPPNEEPASYELRTTTGARVLWGLAPGAKAPNEMPAMEKVARLVQYLTDHGSLEPPAGQVLDVRKLPPARART